MAEPTKQEMIALYEKAIRENRESFIRQLMEIASAYMDNYENTVLSFIKRKSKTEKQIKKESIAQDQDQKG